MPVERTFDDLLQQAQQMTNHTDNTEEDLPRVDRSLRQILHGASRGDQRSNPVHDAHASILLGSKGIDLPQISNKLESLSSARTLEPLTPVADTDLATFLTNERQNAIITAIEDAKRQTRAECERLFWEQQKSEWEQTKQNLMSAFTHSSSDLLNITVQQQESVTNISRGVGSSSLSSDEVVYVKVIKDYNTEILHGGIKPNLAETLASGASVLSDQTIKSLWAMIRSITEVPISLGSNVVKSRSDPAVQSALVKQARRHLEKSYETLMQNQVYNHLERAQLGGVPGTISLVRAYLNAILPPQAHSHLEDGVSHNAPVWPLIFYCLRAGNIKAAHIAASDNNNPGVVEIANALKQYDQNEHNHLPQDTEKKLRLAYKRCCKTITDPFKRAVYCILGRCDTMEDHSDIIPTTDDYLWLKLSLVSFGSPSGSANTSTTGVKQDELTLTQLQKMLYQDYGENHFNAWQHPVLYTSVLLLTGQFEAGVEFLSRIERLRCHAIHIALALFEMNLLALPSQVNAPMLSHEEGDPEGVKRLNLTRLILLYTRKFETTDPCEALHYCYFLRSLKDKNNESVFTGCISELVLQSKEVDLLLGRLNPDGSKTPGIVDKFKVDVCEVTELVARDSEKKGLHEDAIKLYDLAKNHEKVLSLLNQLLSQVVHQQPKDQSSGSQRERVVDLATSIALRFKTHGHNASPQSAATLHLILDLATFFELYHQELYSEALEVLKRLRIIALARSEVEPRVANIASLSTEVRGMLAQVLLAAMMSTHKLYKSPQSANVSHNISIMNSSIQNSPASKHLREQARAIVTFAGMIPLRLHADVNARLVQLEALIN